MRDLEDIEQIKNEYDLEHMDVYDILKVVLPNKLG